MCIRVCARVHVSKPARVCACILVCVQCSLDIRNPHRRTEKSVLMSFSAHRIIPCPLSFFFLLSIHSSCVSSPFLLILTMRFVGGRRTRRVWATPWISWQTYCIVWLRKRLSEGTFSLGSRRVEGCSSWKVQATACLLYEDNTYHASLTWEAPDSMAVHCRHFGRESQDKVNESDDVFVRMASLCFVNTGARQLQKYPHFPGGMVLAAPSDSSQKSPVNDYFEDSSEKRNTYYERR